jgi:RNA polymerase sigma factor (sigma-70 family)
MRPTAPSSSDPASSDSTPSDPASIDDDLVARTRDGDRDAYAQLWRRHSGAGLAYAASVTSTFDAADLVSESFTKIMVALRNGNGPRRGFRSYLYATIRNTAATWGNARKEVPVDDPAVFADTRFGPEREDLAWELPRVAEVFDALPERWRRALWYSEVEQLTPPELASILGIKPNAAAALAYRAREGLRRSWYASAA